jgi:hypothetical protein
MLGSRLVAAITKLQVATSLQQLKVHALVLLSLVAGKTVEGVR